jgi:hypothetical protein
MYEAVKSVRGVESHVSPRTERKSRSTTVSKNTAQCRQERDGRDGRYDPQSKSDERHGYAPIH